MDVLSPPQTENDVTSEEQKEYLRTSRSIHLMGVIALLGTLAMYLGMWLGLSTLGVASYAGLGAMSLEFDFSETYNRLWPTWASIGVISGFLVLVMFLIVLVKDSPEK